MERFESFREVPGRDRRGTDGHNSGSSSSGSRHLRSEWEYGDGDRSFSTGREGRSVPEKNLGARSSSVESVRVSPPFHPSQKVLQRTGGTEVKPIGAEVNAGEYGFLISLLFQLVRCSRTFSGSKASRPPSRIGNDAVGTAGVTSILDLQKGAGVMVEGKKRNIRKEGFFPNIVRLDLGQFPSLHEGKKVSSGFFPDFQEGSLPLRSSKAPQDRPAHSIR